MDKDLTIVLVEDDWMVSIGITDYLSAAGFKVVETGSADAALGFLKHQANNVGLLLTDVRIPGSMNGVALAWQVSKLWPWIALLIASEDQSAQVARGPPGSQIVHKPYDPVSLIRIVRQTTAE